MSLLYHRHTKKVIKWVWGAVALLIILGMVFVYSGFGNWLIANI